MNCLHSGTLIHLECINLFNVLSGLTSRYKRLIDGLEILVKTAYDMFISRF